MKTKTIYSVLAVFFCSVFTLMGEVKVYETEIPFSPISDRTGKKRWCTSCSMTTPSLTLDALNALVKGFTRLEVREAYTSRIVI